MWSIQKHKWVHGPTLPKSSTDLVIEGGCMLPINRTSVILFGVQKYNQNQVSPSLSDHQEVLLYNFISNSWTPHSSYPKGVDLTTSATCTKVSDKNYQKYVLKIKSCYVKSGVSLGVINIDIKQ